MIKMNIGALHLPKGLNMLRKIVREPLFAVRSRLAPQISNSGVNVTMLAGRIEKLRITYKKSLEAPRNVNKLKKFQIAANDLSHIFVKERIDGNIDTLLKSGLSAHQEALKLLSSAMRLEERTFASETKGDSRVISSPYDEDSFAISTFNAERESERAFTAHILDVLKRHGEKD